MKIVIENADANDFNELANLARQGKIHTFYMTDEEEWIPVSERLPEKDGRFLICTPSGNVDTDIFMFGGFAIPYVIAWKPLPEPYKKGGAV